MIHWLKVRDSPELDLEGLFLQPAEREEGKRFRHPVRHREWALGRIAAKALVCNCAWKMGLGIQNPRAIHIKRTKPGWPQPVDTKTGQPFPISLSITHTKDIVVCAACPEAEGFIGVDMDIAEPRSAAFYNDYYTQSEKKYLHTLSSELHLGASTVLWCVKEAVLKARHTGLSENVKIIHTQDFSFNLHQPYWRQTTVRVDHGKTPEVYWRFDERTNIALVLALIRL